MMSARMLQASKKACRQSLERGPEEYVLGMRDGEKGMEAVERDNSRLSGQATPII
jgi:hypothetical protein